MAKLQKLYSVFISTGVHSAAFKTDRMFVVGTENIVHLRLRTINEPGLSDCLEIQYKNGRKEIFGKVLIAEWVYEEPKKDDE